MKVPFGQCVGLVSAVSFPFWVAAGPLTVKVLCPDGSPFARSRVFYVSGTNNAVLAGSAITGAESLETDSRGRFEFIPSASNVLFLTANDSWFGVAQSRDLTNRPQILLQNWATIIGRRTNLGKPVAAKRENISFDARCFGLDDVPIILRDEATTDVSGSFVFSKVPAEGLMLLEADPGKDLWHVADFIALGSGETRHLKIATSARFVSGQLVNKSGVGEASGFAGFVGGLVPASYLKSNMPALPAEYDKPGERTRWWHRWYKSEAGRNIFRPIDQRGAQFVVQSNGFFVSDAPIAPGMYRVGGNQKIEGLIVSHADQVIEVPIPPVDSPANPWNIGAVNLRPAVKPGDLIPDFTATNLDGGTFRLSRLRGKYVLMDFWATWCGPCVQEMKYLKATHETFGKDPRFTMVSLSVDDDPATVKSFLQRNSCPWNQVFLGNPGQSKLLTDFDIGAFPSIWLVDPNGKLISRKLRGLEVQKEVGRMLEPLPERLTR